MPVPKITADQFATDLNNGILDRNSSADVEIGPIPDIVVQPTAQVLENQNDRIRLVSQLILLDQSSVFEDSDVDNFVFNESLIRLSGGRSSGTVIFSRAAAPDTDITVQRNFPIATQPDESTGQTVTFITTESKTMVAVNAAAYYNLATNRYELEVAIQATIGGQLGEVGPNRVNRPLRPLAGFDTVTNINRTSSVVDRETNDELLERYRIAIMGTQLPTSSGLRLFIQSNFGDVGSILVANAGDPIITRSGEAGSAVDVFISGVQSATRTENYTFYGRNVLVPVMHPPLLNITSVTRGVTTYVLNTDYVIVKDTSGNSGSVRGQDGIMFITGGAAPPIYGTFQIKYEENVLVENIQNEFASPDRIVGGQDILIRAGNQIDLVISARLIVYSGYSWTTVANAVKAAVVSSINAMGLGTDVEQSDLQQIIRGISGVDNFIFTILDRKSVGTGNTDIVIEKNEFPRIDIADIALTT